MSTASASLGSKLVDAMTTRSPARQLVSRFEQSCVLPAFAVAASRVHGSARLAVQLEHAGAVHGDHLRWRVDAGIVARQREHHPVRERRPLGADEQRTEHVDAAGGELEIALVRRERSFDLERRERGRADIEQEVGALRE